MVTWYIRTEVMMASSTGDRSHWHLTAGDNTDNSISSIASATYMGQIPPAIQMIAAMFYYSNWIFSQLNGV